MLSYRKRAGLTYLPGCLSATIIVVMQMLHFYLKIIINA